MSVTHFLCENTRLFDRNRTDSNKVIGRMSETIQNAVEETGNLGYNMDRGIVAFWEGSLVGKWYENAVFYHMYPIGMTGAPRRNESQETVHRFQDLMKWLPHIKSLGCTAIYIWLLFESTSHGYDTKDYRMVDRRLGDNRDFKNFVEKAHEMDIRVVVDGVFNHTGREFFAFQDIQKNREQSQYCSWYKGINFGWNSPYNDGFGYEAWRNCFELVNLNLWEPKVREYLLDVIGFWIDEFDIDGSALTARTVWNFPLWKK